MRTNIDIDDELMASTMTASAKSTKKAAVEEAMRYYVRAMALRNLVEGMRGIEWDDGLGTEREFEVAEDAAPFSQE
jgi:Arc/MetJ family transcription regulator